MKNKLRNNHLKRNLTVTLNTLMNVLSTKPHSLLIIITLQVYVYTSQL